jgi:uncharacterized protein YdhG (YjbR/CyaY superfamily)
MRQHYATIDDYIRSFPENIQNILEKMRQTIRKAAPDVVEAISYQMPTFKLNGTNLVHFAAFKNHIGFYPTASGIEAFKKALANYKWSKGAVQFPIDKPVPFDLVEKIVKFRVTENLPKKQKC